MLELPYPHKALWPNGRAHYQAKARETKKHRDWAISLARGQLPVCFQHNGEPIPIHITVSGKAKGPLPDADNCSASAKAYLDGIAFALGVNDRNFQAPVVDYLDARQSRFYIRVGVA